MVHPGTLISQDGPREWLSRSVEDTEALGRMLARELIPDGVLLIIGDLGAGKTVLARGVATGLGIGEREIQSPTFILVREHEGSEGRLIHVDLYRLESTQVAPLGLEEMLHGPGVKVVEWADRIPFPVPGALRLMMDVEDEGRVRRVREVSRRSYEEDGPIPSAIDADVDRGDWK